MLWYNSLMKPRCKECGGDVILKAGDEIKPGFVLAPDVVQADICMTCLRKGWSEATPEDFMADSGFTVVYKSPIQPKDL